uniref:Reverse transcriptase RNase H-like domain-containing protein n=1 Tax=Fagus sylvatica TaxID=28930 RepID=A0A2N9J7A9_FAGSY
MGPDCPLQEGPTPEEGGLQPSCHLTQQTGNSEGVVVDQAESMAMKEEKSTTAEPKMIAKEELEVINLSDDPNVGKPISISMSLSAEERKCLIDLLHEYKDVCAWDYDKMPRIDPRLVAHSLNVEPSTRPVVQLMRTFHTEVEAQITQEVKKLLAAAKASAIATMKAPASHKELKSFLGRLSYIRRFIPGLAAVTAVFTPLMKKGVSFVLSMACQQAFEKIQAIMTKLPTVCAPVAGRPLRLYLASNGKAIGALIAQKDESGTEKPVYYVNRALRDAKTRYSGVEQACLALMYASQRLRHYFLAHKIQLMTKSHPIRSLLHRPVLSGRLAQWFLQLSQYEIIIETSTAIKSQAIADLLAQFPREDDSSISHEVPEGVGVWEKRFWKI